MTGRAGGHPRTPPDEAPPEERFLRLLDPNDDVAREKYAALFARLTKFFEWRRCADPEDLAAITILRVCERVESGTELQRADNTPFFFAVAKNILLEERRAQVRAQASVPLTDQFPAPASDWSRTDDGVALRQCLSYLSPDNRALLIGYFLHGSRDELCQRYGLTPGNLRVTVHRLMNGVKARVRAMHHRPVNETNPPCVP